MKKHLTSKTKYDIVKVQKEQEIKIMTPNTNHIFKFQFSGKEWTVVAENVTKASEGFQRIVESKDANGRPVFGPLDGQAQLVEIDGKRL